MKYSFALGVRRHYCCVYEKLEKNDIFIRVDKYRQGESEKCVQSVRCTTLKPHSFKHLKSQRCESSLFPYNTFINAKTRYCTTLKVKTRSSKYRNAFVSDPLKSGHDLLSDFPLYICTVALLSSYIMRTCIERSPRATSFYMHNCTINLYDKTRIRSYLKFKLVFQILNKDATKIVCSVMVKASCRCKQKDIFCLPSKSKVFKILYIVYYTRIANCMTKAITVVSRIIKIKLCNKILR